MPLTSENHHNTAKTHCPRGHELREPNLVPSNLRRGWRSCLACQRASSRISVNKALEPERDHMADLAYRSIMRTEKKR